MPNERTEESTSSHMWGYYWQLARAIPSLLLDATDKVGNVLTLVVVVIAILLGFNVPVGQRFSEQWLGFNPVFALIPIILLVVFSLAKANFQHVQRLERQLIDTQQRLEQAQTLKRLDVSDATSVGDRGHMWVRLCVSNTNLEPIDECYCTLLGYRCISGDDDSPLPTRGQAFPWSSRGGQFGYTRTIGPIDFAYLDIARSLSLGAAFDIVRVLEVDNELRQVFELSMRGTEYEAYFQIGSRRQSILPTIVKANMILNHEEDWAKTIVDVVDSYPTSSL